MALAGQVIGLIHTMATQTELATPEKHFAQ